MKRFLIWVIRGFIFAVLVPGIVNAISGHTLYVLMRFLSWPISKYVQIMPGDSNNDLGKWIYTASTLFLELTLVIGIVLTVSELRGRPRLSDPSMRFIAYLLDQIEVSIQKAWNVSRHECDFYWLVSIKGEDGYDYFTSDRHLTDEDKKVIREAFERKRDLVEELDLRKFSPRHPAYEYIFMRNSGKFQIALMVFINKQGVLNNMTINAFQEIVEPIISLDGAKEIVLELTKRRGEIVV
jgi:hypothetical protein